MTRPLQVCEKTAPQGCAQPLKLVLLAVAVLASAGELPAQSSRFFGKVVPLPNHVADVYAMATGRIISPLETRYTVGDQVKAGDPVAIIEHRYNMHDASHISNLRWYILKGMLEARYLALEARIDREQGDRLFDLGSIPGGKLQELREAEQVTKAEYNRQRSLLGQHDEQIQGLTIKRQAIVAPIDGEISQTSFSQGQIVFEGFLLYRIVNREQVAVSARIPEADFHRWPEGTTATIGFDGLAGRQFTGRLEKILPLVDPDTRTRDVLFQVGNPDGLLRFGMVGQVQVSE
jgi:RND family efflux transporter MFP subunit